MIVAELPGLDAAKLAVMGTGHTLTISGERDFEPAGKGLGYHRRELNTGKFSRSIQLPEDYEPELWELASQVARDKPTPIGATIVTGMNDVLNSEDYSEAARINHLPIGVWFLLILIALFGCVVQGYGAKGKARKGWLIIILPVTISLSLALIADIDSPRAGIIRVQPQNLVRLLQSLQK